MFQEAFLFAATVRENLALGWDATDDELLWALEAACARRFVERLPLGLDQLLGERGVTLSGGQRQRLALARALLRRPGLLMLDDATSAVDPTVERQILDGLADAARHDAGRRPPPLDDRPGRPRPVPGRRPHRRQRHPPGAARVGARLRLPRPSLRTGCGVTLDERDAPSRRRSPGSARRRGRRLGGDRASGASDEERPHPLPTPDETHILEAGALAVLRRGVAATPELRQGILFTALMALATAAGKLAVPVLIQQILDRGCHRAGGSARNSSIPPAPSPPSPWSCCTSSTAPYLRLVRASENSLLGLRVRTFDHIHRLSMAEHNEQRRGHWWPGSRATSRPWPSSWSGGRWRGSSTASSSSPPSP